MSVTKKRIVDDILNVVDRFSRSDDSRKDETWLGNKIDQVRAQLIIAQYKELGQVDRTWFTDLGLKTFHQVNFADDPNVSYCKASVSKTTIPDIVPISSRFDSNIELGLYVLSACGTKEYTPYPLSMWNIPKEHVRSKFPYYDRINTALYVNKKVDKLRIYGVLASPEDGYIISSSPVLSGSLVSGTHYIVRGVVIYNSVPYQDGSELTATATASYTGTGTLYLKTQQTALTETLSYPASIDMARQIVLEICTKEFKIEESQVTDVINNSTDES